VLGVVPGDMVFHPAERDLPEVSMFPGPIPSLRREGEQVGDMGFAQFPEMGKDGAGVLGAIVAFDRPEFVVIAGEIGAIFLDDALRALEIDLLPVTEVGKDFDDSPSPVRTGLAEGVVVMVVEDHPLEFVGKGCEGGENFFPRLEHGAHA